MAFRPKWAVPQSSSADPRPSHIITPPAAGVVNQTVSPPVATASASSLVPVPQLRLLPAAATASASALVPTVSTSGATPVDVQDIFGGVQSTALTPAAWALTTTVTVAAGNWIVIMCGAGHSSARSLASVSGGGLTWNVDVTTSNTRMAAIASAYAPSGLASSTVITLTWSGTTATGKWAAGREVSGLAATTSLDQTGTNSAAATTTPVVSTAGATGSGSEFSAAAFTQVVSGATSGTPLGSYVEEGDVTIGTARFGYGEAKVITGGSVETASFTSTANSQYDAVIATYIAGGGGPANQTVNAPVATASADALDPVVPGLQVPPGVATSTASSLVPVPQLQVPPGVATASASGPVPTLQLNVSPAVATASASALVPTVTAVTLVSPPVATATASSLVPVPQLRVLPAAATASASSLVPTVTSAPVVSPPVATATASSPLPTIQLQVSPAVATASASGLVPTVAAVTTVSPPVATASASAPVPVPQLKVLPPVGTASTSAPTPVPQTGIVVPVATASANGPPPTLKLGVAPGVSTASASSLVPVPKLQVNIPTRGAVVFGYSNNLIVGTQAQDAERLIGRTFRGLRQNSDIPANWDILSSHNNEYKLGRTLSYRAVQINSGTWSDVTAGTYDANITSMANNIVSAGTWSPSNPFYVCFHHEATTTANTAFGNGQNYIDAFRHFVDVLDAGGYTVTKKDGTANGGPIVVVLVHFQRAFTNTLELGGSETPPAGLAHSDFDPDGGSSPAPNGTTYYSGIGIDSYNSITSAGHLKYGTTASNMFAGVVAQAASTNKFTFIGEFGTEDGTTTTDHQNKAAWLDSCRAYFTNLIGTVQQPKALLFTIKYSAENYNVDSSQESIDAFRRFGLDANYYPDYATGFGQNPTLPVTVPVATASASALVPVVTGVANQTVSPPAATASASALTPTPQLRVSPAAATASASSLVPTVTAASLVSPPVTTANASAPVPTVQLRVSPAAATANASALVPTVGTNPVVSPPVATASASAPLPTIQLQVSPAASTASASALVPLVSSNPVVLPPAATASGSAPVPVPQLRVSPGVATATASALVPVPALTVLPGVSTAAASALVPTVTATTGNQTVSPPVATATASSLVPVPALQVLPGVTTANASAPVPTLQDRVSPPVATANASAPAPTIQVRVSPAVATASASALVPSVQVRVIVPAATANASALAPTISGQVNQFVLPPVATASASAKVPTVQAVSLVSAPVATAIAFAPIPSVVQKQWPQHTGTQWPPDFNLQWPVLTDAQWAAILGLQWPPDSDDQWE